MDPELIQQVNEQLTTMSQLFSAQTTIIANQLKAINEISNTTKLNTNASSQSIKEKHVLDYAITGNIKKAEAIDQANKFTASSSDQFTRASKESINALTTFASAMTSVTPGMSKYAGSVSGLTDSAGSLLSNFGLLGKVTSGLLSVVGGLIGYSFKYTDAVVQGYDDIAKSGARIGMSAESVLKIAHSAGLSSQTLGLFTKNVNQLGDNIRSLGLTSSQGADTFGKMIAVGDKNLIRFRNLGYSQEDLIDSMTTYVDLQAKAGADMKKSPESLKKSAMAYVKELTAMAEITGISAKKQQDGLEMAMAQENYQAYRTDLEMKRSEAIKNHNDAEADRIKAEIASADKTASYAEKTMGTKGATAVLQAISSDGAAVMTENTARLEMSGYNLNRLRDKIKKGQPAFLELAHQQAKSNQYLNDKLGELRYRYGEGSKEIQSTFSDEIKTRQNAMKNQDLASDEGLAKAEASFNTQKQMMEAKEKAQAGEVARRAQQEAYERRMRQSFDDAIGKLSIQINDLVMSLMPTMIKSMQWVSDNFNLVLSAAKALTIAFGVLAGVAVVGKITQTGKSLKDGITGLFKSKSSGEPGSSDQNRMYIKLATKGDELSKISNAPNLHMPDRSGSGGPEPGSLKQNSDGKWVHTASGRKGQFASTKEIIAHEEGTLNRNGRPLHGAAKSARLQSLAESTTNVDDSKTPGFLSGIKSALEEAGKSGPLIIAGAAALGASIAELGAGIAGATWIMGKALPTFADGMKSFNEVDGKNLKGVGIGLAGFGAGVLAIGASAMTNAIGNIVTFFSGGDDPLANALSMLKDMQNWKIDRKKVEDNGSSLIAYAKTMAAIAAVGAGASIAGAIKGFYDGVAGLFNTKAPYIELEKFASLDIDFKKVKDNASALSDFGNAVAEFKGSSKGAGAAAIAEAATNFFKTTPPYVKLFVFGMLPINETAVKKNATAFKQFSEAISSYKGYGSNSGTLGSVIADAVAGFFKVKLPVDKIVEFSNLKLNTSAVKLNAEAFKSFAEAISSYKGYGSNSSSIGSSMAEASVGFFSVTPPFDEMKKFGEITINEKRVKQNAKAFKFFTEALASFKGFGNSPGIFATVLADATSKFFKVMPPLDNFVYFSQLNINQKKTKNNAKSFVLFSEAMASYRGGEGLITAVSTIAGAKLNQLFGQDSAIDAFYNFSKKDFGQNVDRNAKAFLNFSKAMGILSGGNSSNPSFGSSLGQGISTVIGTVGGFAGGVISSIGGLLGKIIKAESGGKSNAAAKTSSAYGLGQFTKGTFEGIAREKGSPVFGTSWEQYKQDPNVQMKALEYLIKKNQNFLAKSGIPVNDASTYLSHFLGPAGARNIYRHADSESLSQVVNAAAYNANKSVFEKAKTVGGLKNWANAKMGGPSLQARKGGLFSGPTGGYPMVMHGTEIIIPSVPDSLLTHLATEDFGNLNESISNILQDSRPDTTVNKSSGLKMETIVKMDNELREMLLHKIIKVLQISKEHNDTSEKILRHTRS